MQKAVPTADDAPGPNGRSVAHMFDRIAPTYDRLNHLLSLGMDFSWRRRAVGQFDRDAGAVIDLATGTGDLLIALLRARPDLTGAVGLDASENMLAICRAKLDRRRLGNRATLVCGDAAATSFDDATFDAVTMAFGLRNMPDVAEMLAEMYRTLKPGGTAVILEFSLPPNRLLRRCYLLYLRLAVPLVGVLVSGDKQAYRYLNTSIERFAQPEHVLRMMQQAGFSSVAAIPLTFGVASIYRGNKA